MPDPRSLLFGDRSARRVLAGPSDTAAVIEVQAVEIPVEPPLPMMVLTEQACAQWHTTFLPPSATEASLPTLLPGCDHVSADATSWTVVLSVPEYHFQPRLSAVAEPGDALSLYFGDEAGLQVHLQAPRLAILIQLQALISSGEGIIGSGITTISLVRQRRRLGLSRPYWHAVGYQGGATVQQASIEVQAELPAEVVIALEGWLSAERQILISAPATV